MIEVTQNLILAFRQGWDPDEDDQRIRNGLTKALALVEEELSAGWLIWSNEHQMWWKDNQAGYTADVMCAGRYAREDALAETGVRTTLTGQPGEVVVRAPHVSLIGNRDLAGMMRAAVEAATRIARDGAA